MPRPRVSIRLATFGALIALVSCGKDGSDRQSGIAGIIDAERTILEHECECYGAEYFESTQACIAEFEEYLDEDREFFACLERILDSFPQDRRVYDCFVERMYDYADCVVAEGCAEQFTCDDGSTIPAEWVCDGDQDCAGGEDEAGEDCDTQPFMCDDGETIPASWVCDDFPHCENGEDEADCPGPFMCDDGETIPASWVCDGFPDCVGGEDEAGDCPFTCESHFAAVDTCGEPSEAFLDRLDEECDVWDSDDEPCVDGNCASFPPDTSEPEATQDLVVPDARGRLDRFLDRLGIDPSLRLTSRR